MYECHAAYRASVTGAFLMFKKILGKINLVLRNREFASVKIGKHSRIGTEGKAKPIGAQRLILVSLSAVIAIDAVFSIPEQGVTEEGKMRADLMRSSCQQLNLEQGKITFFGNHTVPCADRLCAARRILIVNADLLCFFVFEKI